MLAALFQTLSLQPTTLPALTFQKTQQRLKEGNRSSLSLEEAGGEMVLGGLHGWPAEGLPSLGLTFLCGMISGFS